jgi:hypothetical protein
MHDADLVALVIARTSGAGVRQAGLFFHRQRVHVGAQHDDRAVAVAQHTDHAMPTDLARDFGASQPEFRCDPGGGVFFLKRKLRVRVPMAIQSVQVSLVVRDPGGHGVLQRG